MHPRLVGALSLYTGDRAIAHELAQECLVRVCRDWRKVQKVSNRDAWALRVAMNLANSHFRRRAAERRAKDRLEARSQRTAVDPDWAWGVALREALGSLPQRQRTVLILRFYADLTFAEIAAEMDTGEATVKSLARRGIERLRDNPDMTGVEEVRLV